MSYSLDHTTGDPLATAAGGLGVKVIRHAVYDDGPSDHIGGLETVGVDGQQRHAVRQSQKRRKISGMPGMGNAMGIVVPTGLGKGNVASGRAITLFVNVETQEPRFRQSDQPYDDQAAASIGGEKCFAY